ncbi:MAG: general stress protein [Gemmatimonadales bacterium]|nr:general stress protein [Gemmatimonadales bacterium]
MNHSEDVAAQDTTGRTVVGLFDSRGRAEAAIRDLKAAGFAEDQIGVAMQDRSEQQNLMDETGSQAAEGAAKGAVSGGVVGGLMGLLGSLLIPGVGPIVVGGVLASTLAGAGIGAATGGIIGALMGLGVPEEDAQHFDLKLRSGGILVTVDAGSQTGRALGILQRHEVDFGPTGGRHYGNFEEMPGVATAAFGNLGVTGSGDAFGTDAGAGSVGLPGLTTPGLGAGDVASGSSTGNRGMPSRKGYQGTERRTRSDPNYRGPERRLVGV